MKKNLTSAFLLIFISSGIFAQKSENVQNTFTPNGKPIVTVYTDFANTTSNGKSNNAFEVSRAYFGYGYNFSSDFSGKIVFDIANSGGLNPSAFTAFLKNAYAEYSGKKVKVEFGLIGTNIFNLQESNWGKRYLYKSFQDEYGFGSAADLGAKVTFQFAPEISLDLGLYNGEGYKKIQADSAVQVAAGLTVKPVKNLYARIYFDYMKKNVAQNTINATVGYKSEKGSIAAEYNIQNGHGMVDGHNYSGLSVYGTLPFAKKYTAFARFDDLMSAKIGSATTGWNSADGQVYILGLEYFPVKGIQISPNVRYSNLAVGNSSTGVYLNVGLSL